MNFKSQSYGNFKEAVLRNYWLEKYIDNYRKLQSWSTSRNYTYFFSHGKSFGVCRVIMTGRLDSGKSTLLFSLKALLEESKGQST